MKQYQLVVTDIYSEPKQVIDLELNLCIPFDEANKDYQQYLAWLAEGNTPLPSDAVIVPPEQPK